MKNITILFLILSLVGFGVAYFLLHIYNCGHSSFCNFLIFDFARPLLYGTGALAIIFFVLLFVPRAFPVWKKFAVWAIPLIALLFSIWPTSRGGGMGVAPSFIGPSAIQVYQWVSALYVITSIIIIGRVVVNERKNP